MLPAWSPLLTAVACMLGHIFPLYLGFKGGKGVATSFGVVLGFWPLFTLAGLAAGLVFVVALMLWRYISLASITAAIWFGVFVTLLGRWQHPQNFAYLPWGDLQPLLFVGILFAVLIVFKHRANVVRLLKGTEPKVGQRQTDAAKMK